MGLVLVCYFLVVHCTTTRNDNLPRICLVCKMVKMQCLVHISHVNIACKID